jgi:hypothetical protein
MKQREGHGHGCTLLLFRSVEEFPFTLKRQTRAAVTDLGVLNTDGVVACSKDG